jgi:hypothetical protein
MKKILFSVLLASPLVWADQPKGPQEDLAHAMFSAGKKIGKNIIEARDNLLIEVSKVSDEGTNQILTIKLNDIDSGVDKGKEPSTKLSIEYQDANDGSLVELIAQEDKLTGSISITTSGGQKISGPVGSIGPDSPLQAFYVGFVLGLRENFVKKSESQNSKQQNIEQKV